MADSVKIYVGKGPSDPTAVYGNKLFERMKDTSKLFASEALEKEFLEIVDRNNTRDIDDVEAKEALKLLDMYSRPDIKVLTKKDIEEIRGEAQALAKTSSNPVYGLNKIGRVYELTISDKNYQFVIIEKAKLDALGIDLNAVFANEEGQRKDFSLQGPFLTGLNMSQSIALAKAIEAKLPELKGKLGMFNMGPGSLLEDTDGAQRHVKKVLFDSFLAQRYGVAGAKFVERRLPGGKSFRNHPELVLIEDLKKVEYIGSPHSSDIVEIFGVIKP